MAQEKRADTTDSEGQRVFLDGEKAQRTQNAERPVGHQTTRTDLERVQLGSPLARGVDAVDQRCVLGLRSLAAWMPSSAGHVSTTRRLDSDHNTMSGLSFVS